MCLPAALKLKVLEKFGSCYLWYPSILQRQGLEVVSGLGHAHRTSERSCAPCCPQPTKAQHAAGSSPVWDGWRLPGYQKAILVGRSFSVLLLSQWKPSTDIVTCPELCIPVVRNRFACTTCFGLGLLESVWMSFGTRFWPLPPAHRAHLAQFQ